MREAASQSDRNGEQKKQGDIFRNFCIMAHVDHGKTSLADSLIASNGLISESQAGSMRYMDNLPDEIARGITMKSSCITLSYTHHTGNYIMNLIDSPGHVDFSSEVSTAVRLCDGCVLVVDVVEGVCAQTKAVIRQAWGSFIKPVLVLNKIDRLIVERNLTPLEAYYQLQNVLEQVNAYLALLHKTEMASRIVMNENVDANKDGKSHPESGSKKLSDWLVEDDTVDSRSYFQPSSGNVVFASAKDRWGFNCATFAKLMADKTGASPEKLCKTLWGDYYLTGKGDQKKIMQGARAKNRTPLFVPLVLDNIYQLYKKARPVESDIESLRRMCSLLNISVPDTILESQTNERFVEICARWLPLSNAVCDMVVEHVKAPTRLSESRAQLLLSTAITHFDALPLASRELSKALVDCDSSPTSPLVVYVSKMFGVKKDRITAANEAFMHKQAVKNGRLVAYLEEKKARRVAECLEEQYDATAEEAVGFARVFSGSLEAGSEVYVLGPKHNPADMVDFVSLDGKLKPEFEGTFKHIIKCKVGAVYLMEGKDLTRIMRAKPGMLVAVSGLSESVIKSASLSDTVMCPAFTHANAGAYTEDPNDSCILRVQILPKDSRKVACLRDGLRKLNQADPSVRIWIQRTGEYIIGTAGEVHLSRCINDLTEKYAKIEITVSEPIVPFKETIIRPPTIDRTNEAIEKPSLPTSGGSVTVVSESYGTLSVKAVPLPTSVRDILHAHSLLLRALAKASGRVEGEQGNDIDIEDFVEEQSQAVEPVQIEQKSLDPVAETEEHPVTGDSDASQEAEETCVTLQVEKMTLKVSEKSVKNTEGLCPQLRAEISVLKEKLRAAFTDEEDWDDAAVDQMWSVGPYYSGASVLLDRTGQELANLWSGGKSANVDSSLEQDLVNAFQHVCRAGSLCEEPLAGVGIVVERWESPSEDVQGRLGSWVSQTMTQAVELQPRRLLVAMLSCNVNVNQEMMGRLHSVLDRRHGHVTAADVVEGSTMWNIQAFLPVVESIDCASEIRKQTSGEAQPQLVFSHWEVLDEDPFWDPETEEELLHYGEKADSENQALVYMNGVRRRKGIKEHGKKLVEFGEKQRTLTRNK